MPLADQVMIFFAIANGYLDDVPIRRVSQFEVAFLRHMNASHPELVQLLAAGNRLGEDAQGALGQAIMDFKANATY